MVINKSELYEKWGKHTNIKIKTIILAHLSAGSNFSKHRILGTITLSIIRYEGSGTARILLPCFARMDEVSHN
jgi:hypothetical protein